MYCSADIISLPYNVCNVMQYVNYYAELPTNDDTLKTTLK